MRRTSLLLLCVPLLVLGGWLTVMRLPTSIAQPQAAAPMVLAHPQVAGSTADIEMTAWGCTAQRYVLPADHEPQVRLFNAANEAMVFSLPKMVLSIVVEPQQSATLDLPRYIMGEFDFFCLTDAAHTVLGGGSEFVCSLEPQEIQPYALTAGRFVIAQHDRLAQDQERGP